MRYEEMKAAVQEVSSLMYLIKNAQDSLKMMSSISPDNPSTFSQFDSKVSIHKVHCEAVIAAIKEALNKCILEHKTRINTLCPGEYPELTKQEDIREMEL